MSNYSALTKVNNFESLIEYLRDELDWDFQAEDIEDLTFDYEPEELGLDEATSAKIDGIKQLRPLTNNQTWGIFYIDFEPKKLPIVALRRILGKLVVKRRTSANQSDRAAWQMNDLLFLSSYGENRTRTMSFAHFSDNSVFGDLPTLKTITWNNLDTPLHLQHAHETLKTKLKFPDDPNDSETWRETWASAFTQRHGEVIRTSQQLARRLAELASDIREKANDILYLENEKGELRKLHKAFQEALIHDLTYDDFADMYAQTISYGLLTAKISRPAGLVADNIADMIPVTNPFLKELLQTFLVVGGRGNLIDFDELGINDVVEMLRRADMEAVLRDFGDKNPNEDPAIHFYELFLKEYDPEKRMKRGVFYTPRPVVSFIVRSVHEILQKEFNLPDGLADTTTWGEMKARHKDLEIPAGVKETAPFVQILDPATGTGTFLVEVIEQIHQTLGAKWQSEGKSKAEQTEAWNEYVPKNLLPRLYGFELMMAPYSIAHMKIGLKLSETGYRFLSSERAQIYLTNTLEEPKDFSDYFAVMSPALAHEAEAANKVKRQTPITVIVGNPPYSVSSQNKGEWITNLLSDYKEGLNEKKLNLDDDFIKFLRVSQFAIEKTNIGVLGIITNHSYLDAITHRRIREFLTKTFKEIFVLDLHGNTNKKEISADGSKDENVFDIKQGVAITIAARNVQDDCKSKVKSSEFWGLREDKYNQLLNQHLSSLNWQELTKFERESCLGKFFFFVPKAFDNIDEYCRGWSLKRLFSNSGQGVKTERDHVSIHWTQNEVQNTINDFKNLDEKELRIKYSLGVDSRDWKITNAKKDVAENIKGKFFNIISYRPFDSRNTWYSGTTRGFIGTPSSAIMENLIDNRLSFIGKRQSIRDPFSYIFCAKGLVESCIFESAYANAVVFPLYLKPSEKDKILGLTFHHANFSEEFIEEFSNNLELEFVYNDETAAESADTFTPEDVFAYAYAVFHSPTYRSRYAEFLKIDFPRLPLTNDVELFRTLCAHGNQLVKAHLLEDIAAPPAWNLHTDGTALFQNTEVAAGFPKYEDGKVFINKTTYFKDVPGQVWNFHIGGYQVCHKWLKDRKGRTLSEEDINHYGKITVALNNTIRLMAEIDEVIEEHGGFPLVGSQE